MVNRKSEAAIYTHTGVAEFEGNPLIEALPQSMSPSDISDRLMLQPPYSDRERQLDATTRLTLTQRITRFHQPGSADIEIAMKLFNCMKWGYTGRNPITAGFRRQQCRLQDAIDDRLSLGEIGGYYPNTHGFSILGVSGLGKTSTVENILAMIPQVIHHTNYRGIPFQATQVTWLKLDCPSDGSVKSLCISFFEKLDELLGTDYHETIATRRRTIEYLRMYMAKYASIYHIGLFVIDEIQHLTTAKKGMDRTVLNFFVSLVNDIGVPVITVGTPKACEILQKEFQQARRGSGQGDVMLERYRPQDAIWRMLVEVMWDYQYTRETVPRTPEMLEELYNQTLGIPFLAVQLYKLVQDDAILYKRETFGKNDFKRVADKEMKLTKPMRDAIRSGKEIDMHYFDDIAPFREAQYSNNVSIAAERALPAVPPPPKETILDDAVITLMRMGLSSVEAKSYAAAAIAEHRTITQSSVIASEAYMAYVQKKSAANGTAENGATADDTSTDDAPVNPILECDGYGDLLEAGCIG